MLRLPDFNYVRPTSLKEAVRMLAEFGGTAMAVAGGTDVYAKMKRGQFTPPHLVSLKTLPELRGINADDEEGILIGAGETLTTVSRNRAIDKLFPAITQAAHSVSTPQLRNMGTIGGNVCVDTRCNYYDQTFFWRQAVGFCMKKDGDICLVAPGSSKCVAVFSSDTAPVFCSLGAIAVLHGPEGVRRVRFDDFYRNDGINFLGKRPDEVMRAILIPRESFGWRNTYLKLRRRDSFDFPVLGVAAAMNLARDGTCIAARVVLTAVASCPQSVDSATKLLEGKKPNQELIEAVADAAVKASHPLDNTDMTYWYRKRMTRAFVAKALASLCGVTLKVDAHQLPSPPQQG